jgi:hypothetical protein
MPSSHSRLSPSGAERWLACPGSLKLEAKANTSSIYAAEGTCAHSLCEECFYLGEDPMKFVGQVRNVDGYDIEITEEMAESVTVYLSEIEANPLFTPELEQRLESETIEGFGGTIDCFIPATFHIIDFKYGSGIPVDVEWNKQLACYALLVIEKFNNGVLRDVITTIVQPRADHPDGPVRTWVATADWLQAVKAGVEEVASGSSEVIKAGDHCRWCPAKANCPELHQLTIRVAQNGFNDDSGALIAEKLTPETAAEILNKRKAIEEFLGAVEDWAHATMEKGIEVPGYKLVDKYGNRRYSVDEATVLKRCRASGLGKKKIYKSVLISPAQLEKLGGKDLVEPLVERYHVGTKVVPLSARGEAVIRLTATEEFKNVE